jgi:hypothetical protein
VGGNVETRPILLLRSLARVTAGTHIPGGSELVFQVGEAEGDAALASAI